MALAATKGEYHLSLDGVGLLLEGAPNRLAYQQNQAPIYGQRFASGDRDYDDLAKWWYFHQTDFSGGIKDTVAWSDDAKHYAANNIDAYSEPGAIKCETDVTLNNTFTENIRCGMDIDVNGTVNHYIGTDDDSGSKPRVYKYSAGSWSSIFGGFMPTSQNIISHMLGYGGYHWTFTVGSGSTYVVFTWDGATQVDQSGYLNTLLGWQPASSRGAIVVGSTLYVLVDDFLNNRWAIVSTDVASPTAAADWDIVIQKTNTDALPIAINYFQGQIYYMLNTAPLAELRTFLPSTPSTDTSVYLFRNTNYDNWNMSDRAITVFEGKLIVTVPPSQIWSYDGSDMIRIWLRDPAKLVLANNGGNGDFVGRLQDGAIPALNRLWWSNLSYSQGVFFNTTQNITDNGCLSAIAVDNSDILYSYDDANRKKLYQRQAGVYKGSADKNWIILNNIDTVAGVDKLAYSLTLLFKPLTSGQRILVEYALGELTYNMSWTSLGSATFATDGGTIRDKKLFFGAAVIYKKIWLRIKIDGDTSGSAVLLDTVMESLPFPTNTKQWDININASNAIKRLNGGITPLTGRQLKGRLERIWWTKSLIDFEDFDYATALASVATIAATDTTITCSVAGATNDFPEQGRIRIDNEEILYTGKGEKTFTGCIRGARGTQAVSHAAGSVIDNAYKVIIINMTERIPIMLEDKNLEYTIGLTMREA